MPNGVYNQSASVGMYLTVLTSFMEEIIHTKAALFHSFEFPFNCLCNQYTFGHMSGTLCPSTAGPG